MQNPITDYGHIRITRVISDGEHGNVQAERVIPVIVEGDATPEAVQAAEAVAWAAAGDQVAEQINVAFEREGRPAPNYDGPRYSVSLWDPDPNILLITPDRTDVPGGTAWRFNWCQAGHRLSAARRLAELIMSNSLNITACDDYCDGDFTALEKRYGKIQAKQKEEGKIQVYEDRILY